MQEIENALFRYKAGELPLNDFEQWLYATPQIAAYLGEAAYLELISFNFHQPAAEYELSKLIDQAIPLGKFHAWQLKRLLKGLLDGTRDPVVVFEYLYDRYNSGYHFLGHLGIQYLIWVEEIPKLTARQLWDVSAFLRRREVLDEYLPDLRNEIELMAQALDAGDIELINASEYFIKPELLQRWPGLRQVLEHEASLRALQPKTDTGMGTFNLLQTTLTCLHCSTLAAVDIEMRFGDTRGMQKLAIGDSYPWIPGKALQNGGRPENGDLDGEGYTECPSCRRDFFVKVTIRQDRIESAQPDTEKPGYIQPSDLAPAPLTPPTASASWKPVPRLRETGQIIYNEKWNLTASIEAALAQLLKLGVDISSTVNGNDYTFLAPHGLSRQQQDQIDALMNKIAREVHGKVIHVDWYPHGQKFRIYPPH